jgi:hypothetical protein
MGRLRMVRIINSELQGGSPRYYTTKCDTVEDGSTERASEGNPGG